MLTSLVECEISLEPQGVVEIFDFTMGDDYGDFVTSGNIKSPLEPPWGSKEISHSKKSVEKISYSNDLAERREDFTHVIVVGVKKCKN